MPLYCTTNAVEMLLPENVIVDSVANPAANPFNRNAETTTVTDIGFFISQASQEIDGALGTIYDVPFKRTIVGDAVDYPAPIPRICSVLAASLIYNQKLQGGDSQESQAQQKREDWAREQLRFIQNGQTHLPNQRMTRSNRFVRNTILNAPRNPAQGGKSEGSK